MSLRSVLILAGLPFGIVVFLYRFYVLKTLPYRKFKSELHLSFKIYMGQAALRMDIEFIHWVLPYSGSFLVRRLIPFSFPGMTAGLPGYGEKFNSHTFWLVKQPNRGPNDPIILYCHGGGYVLQASPLHVSTILSTFWLLKPETRKRTSILFLDYSLVGKHTRFPTQRDELHQTYVELIHKGYKNITLGGDSAGGHLVVTYAYYLQTLLGIMLPSNMLLFSPWVRVKKTLSDYTPGTSWHDCEAGDFLQFSSTHRFDLDYYIGHQDVYSHLISPGNSLQKHGAAKSEALNLKLLKCGVFLVVGQDESMRDDVLFWAKAALDVPFAGTTWAMVDIEEEAEFEYHRYGHESYCDVTAYVEPWGVHAGYVTTEDAIAHAMENSLRSRTYISVDDLDRSRFFTTPRLVEFLNERL